MRFRPAFATLSLVALAGMPALGQSREDRVNQIAATLSAGITDQSSDTVYTDARTGEEIRATPAQLMRETLTSVNLDAVPGRLALDIWSNQTNVPLVVSWASLEAQGIDPQQPVTLTLGKVPAELALKLIIQQLHPDPIGNDELLVDIEQWYVRIMTKEDALRRSTTRIYFIGDLLMDIPNFDNAPGFDLNDALSNTSSGGSGRGTTGGGGNQDQGLFGDDSDDEEEEVLSKEEKAERIADMVRNTIEPDIWRANGGEYGSVRYYRGMLVVKAPDFVHEQIGGIAGGTTTTKSTSKRKNTSRSSDGNNQDASPAIRRSTPGNVAGVARDRPPIPRSR